MPHYRERGPFRHYYSPYYYGPYYPSYYRSNYYVIDGVKYYNGIPIRKGIRYRPIW